MPQTAREKSTLAQAFTLKWAPEHTATREGLTSWQDSEHLPRAASSGSTSIKQQCHLFRTVYDLSDFYRKELCSHLISDCLINPIFRCPSFD